MPDTSTKSAAASLFTRPLTGKVALVTGSTSGIGLGIARAFAMAGADVALNARKTGPETDKLVAEIKAQAGTKVICVAADMSKPDQVKGAIPAAEKELGKIPFFVRGKARRNTERFAADRGLAVITIETLYDAKAHFGR